MPTVTSHNRQEWIMKEMAKRAGKKYEPEAKKNMYQGMSAAELKEHKAMLESALKEPKEKKEDN